MELATDTAATYLRDAFAKLLAVADRVGDALVNVRPLGDGTNSIASLVVHCAAVAEFWLCHAGLDHATQRDRDAEFDATATVEELHQIVERSLAVSVAALGRLGRGEGRPNDMRLFLHEGDTSDASLVIHVLEELYQHLGHAELAADVLLQQRSERGLA